LALVLGACGDDDDDGGGGGGGSAASGETLTIYSSPLQGTAKEQSEAVIDGERLALKEAGSKVGKFKLKYVSLDDSTAQNPGTAASAALVGAGIGPLALFPLALPLIALTVVPLVPFLVIALAFGLVVAVLDAPLVVARWLRRRSRGSAPWERTEIVGPPGAAFPEGPDESP
jgi:hypothetical protein